MLTAIQLVKLSRLIGKMKIVLPAWSAGQEQFMIDLIFRIIEQVHLAESELYALIAEVNECTVKEAERADVYKFFQELFKIDGVTDFLQSAAKSLPQDS